MSCRCSCASTQAVHRRAPTAFASTQSRAQFFGRSSVLVQRPAGKAYRQSRPAVVEVLDFKFLKKLGLKKPEFLPDFGKDKRQAMLDRFFTSYDKDTLEELLSDNAQIVEQGPKSRVYNKSEWINLLVNHVVPAVPDYSWCHSTDGANDKQGFCTVRVQATGNHTGKPFRVPGSELPKVDARQKQFTLQETSLQVRVEGGKIQEIQMLPAEGAGFLALYEAVGGKVNAA